MKTRLLIFGFALCFVVGNANADVIDNGTTIPTGFATGHVNAVAPDAAPLNSRFGWDAGEEFGQSFTIDTPILLDSIYFAYNGFDDLSSSGDFTFSVDVGNDGTDEFTENITLFASDFSGNSATDSNSGPTYWAQWDVSAENLFLGAGVHSFNISLDSTTDAVSWLLAPLNQLSGDGYTGGAATGVISGPGRDAGFAVTGTAIPEPSSFVCVTLLGLAGEI